MLGTGSVSDVSFFLILEYFQILKEISYGLDPYLNVKLIYVSCILYIHSPHKIMVDNIFVL